MSSGAYEDDSAPPPKKSGGAPTWLIVTLSILLVLGLLCVGGIALMVFGFNNLISTMQGDQLHGELQAMQTQVTGYREKNSYYPESLKEAYAGIGLPLPFDRRDPNKLRLVVEVLHNNAAPTDVLGHSSRKGPLPIVAILLNGTIVEYKSTGELDQALYVQQRREVPANEPVHTNSDPGAVETPDN